MSIDPKDAGLCCSCKFCEDITPCTFSEGTVYMRQCSNPNCKYVDSCAAACPDYERSVSLENPVSQLSEVSFAPVSSPAYPPAVPAEKPRRKGALATILILLTAVLMIGIAVFLMIFLRKAPGPNEGILPSDSPIVSTVPATQPPEDFSLAGQKRYVHTEDGNGLNLREKPNTTAVIMTAIPDSQVVTIEKTVGNWASITCEGESGWCSMDFLVTEEEYEKIVASYLNLPATVATQSSPLRLRQMPSSNSETVASMPKGSEITVLKLEGQWAYVRFEDVCGWCSSQYLDMGGNG